MRSDVNAILFDEPLTVIDPHMKWVLRSQLKQLHRRFGYTMVYVTHDQTEALTFAEKVVVMYEGEIVQIGTPAELFERPKHTFVGYFIGSPGMNVLPVEIDGSSARLGGQTIALPRRAEGRRRRRDRTRHPARICPARRARACRSRSARSRTSAATRSCAPASRAARSRRSSARTRTSRPTRKITFDPAGINIYADSWRVEMGALSHGQDLEQQGLVHGAAGAAAGGVLGGHPADDGGQLFGAGHVRQQRVLLGRHRLVRGDAASDRFWEALGRNLLFSAIILAIEIPLGIFIALNMPKKGWGVPVCLVLMALPLLIPWNVVGTIWQVFGRVDIGLLGYTLSALGIDYNYVNDPFDAWVTVIVMDVWHWTSLVVLLCYAGLVSIPDAYYQAAKIDGASRWAVFRYIQLPKMNRVLLIAVLLRFMDSFMIYTEPFVVTGGGPGNSTTFLSIDLVKMAIGQFDLGPAAAMSIIYFLIILLLSWVFYTVMTSYDAER